VPQPLQFLSAVSPQFDAAVLDQWGVLHDGSKAPPGAIEAVKALRGAGKRLVVLSNSARLGNDASDRLAALGYDTADFTGFVTSGETVRDMLRDRTDRDFAALGRSVFLIAREPTLIEGLDYRATDLERADFVLLGSSTAPEKSLERDHAPSLVKAAERGLLAICANPDRIGVTAKGFIEAPGLLAAHYEKVGGRVRYIGKPHPEVYARCRALLPGIPPERIVAIGDSLEHDVAGGGRAGFRTAFITGGIHAGEMAETEGLAKLSAKFGVTPDWVLPRLAW